LAAKNRTPWTELGCLLHTIMTKKLLSVWPMGSDPLSTQQDLAMLSPTATRWHSSLQCGSASARISKRAGISRILKEKGREQFWSKKGNLHRRKETLIEFQSLGSITCFLISFSTFKTLLFAPWARHPLWV
jgi:hypothetical protein